MAKSTTLYTCQQCGSQAAKWAGKCYECGAWNSLVEETFSKEAIKAAKTSAKENFSGPAPLHLEELNLAKFKNRLSSGFSELDRVLGGGFVEGSLLLFGGEPGIGKSTLLLQVLGNLANAGKRCLYISGEESGPQVGGRASRLLIPKSENLQFIATTDIREALAAVEKFKPEVIVADSVQTLESPDLGSAAGTVSQVREVAQEFMTVSKVGGAITLLVGHVTKEGSIAGPRLLEHMVDAVFYFELAASGAYRLVRGQKNRFGATHELAVFEMSTHGLMQVENPSARFLAERAKETPGSAVVAHLEGSRPFMTEVQALVQKCHQGYPRRTVQGVDQNRVSVLLAVVERALGVTFSDKDVYCKVASGARIEEPAADLALCFSLISAAENIALPADLLLVGEVGLGGEIRSVSGLAARLSEAKGVGMKRACVPAWSFKEAKETKGIQIIPVKNLAEVKELLMSERKEARSYRTVDTFEL